MADSKKKQAFTLQHILIFRHVFSTLCNLGRFHHPLSSVKVLIFVLCQMLNFTLNVGVQLAAHHQERAD